MPPTPNPVVSAASTNRSKRLFPTADPADIRRVERVIAVARVLVSLAIVETAARIAPFRPGDLPLAVFLSYGGISLLVLIALSGHRAMPPRMPIVMQLIDIGVAAIVPWSDGLNGSLAILLVFPLLAAGYRRGLRAVLITTLGVDGLIAGQWAIANAKTGLWLGRAREAFDVTGLNTSMMFVAIAGVVIGYLAENEYQRRAEAAAISHVVAQARPGAAFNGMLHAVLSSICGVFGAQTAVLVLQDPKAARLFRWEVWSVIDR